MPNRDQLGVSITLNGGGQEATRNASLVASQTEQPNNQVVVFEPPSTSTQTANTSLVLQHNITYELNVRGRVASQSFSVARPMPPRESRTRYRSASPFMGKLLSYCKPRNDEYLTKLSNGKLAMARPLKMGRRASESSSVIATDKLSGSSSWSTMPSQQGNDEPAGKEGKVAAVQDQISKQIALQVQAEVSRQMSHIAGQTSHEQRPSHRSERRSGHRRRNSSPGRRHTRAGEFPTEVMDYNVRITPIIRRAETRSHRASETPPPPYPTNMIPQFWAVPAGMMPQQPPSVIPQPNPLYQFQPNGQGPAFSGYQPVPPWVGDMRAGHRVSMPPPPPPHHPYIVPQASPASGLPPTVLPSVEVPAHEAASGPQFTGHVCAHCGVSRSRRYHAEHPIKPGEVPIPDYCGRCQKEDTCSEYSNTVTPLSQTKGKQKEQPQRGQHSKIHFQERDEVSVETYHSGNTGVGRGRPRVRDSMHHGNGTPARSRVSSENPEGNMGPARQMNEIKGSYVRKSRDNTQATRIEPEHLPKLSPTSEELKTSALREIRKIVEAPQSVITVVPISEEKLVVKQVLRKAPGQEDRHASSSSRRRGERMTTIETEVFQPRLPSEVPSLEAGQEAYFNGWHDKYSNELPPEIRPQRSDEYIATRDHFKGPIHHERRSSRAPSHASPVTTKGGKLGGNQPTSKSIERPENTWDQGEPAHAEHNSQKWGPPIEQAHARDKSVDSKGSTRSRPRKSNIYSELRRGDITLDQNAESASNKSGRHRLQGHGGKQVSIRHEKANSPLNSGFQAAPIRRKKEEYRNDSLDSWGVDNQEHRTSENLLPSTPSPPQTPLHHPSPIAPPRRTHQVRTTGAVLSHHEFFRDPSVVESSVSSSPKVERRRPGNSDRVSSLEPVKEGKEMSYSSYTTRYLSEAALRKISPSIAGKRVMSRSQKNDKGEYVVTSVEIKDTNRDNPKPMSVAEYQEVEEILSQAEGPDFRHRTRAGESFREIIHYKRSPIPEEVSTFEPRHSPPESNLAQAQWNPSPRGSPDSVWTEQTGRSNHRPPFVRNATDNGTEIPGNFGPESAIKPPSSRGSSRKSSWEGGVKNGPMPQQYGNRRASTNSRPQSRGDHDDAEMARYEEAKRKLKTLQEDRGSPSGHLTQLIDEHGRPVVDEQYAFTITKQRSRGSVSPAMRQDERHVTFQGLTRLTSSADATENRRASNSHETRAEASYSRSASDSNTNDRHRHHSQGDIPRAELREQYEREAERYVESGEVSDKEWGIEQSLSDFAPAAPRPRPSLLESPVSAGSWATPAKKSYVSAGSWATNYKSPSSDQGGFPAHRDEAPREYARSMGGEPSHMGSQRHKRNVSSVSGKSPTIDEFAAYRSGGLHHYTRPTGGEPSRRRDARHKRNFSAVSAGSWATNYKSPTNDEDEFPARRDGGLPEDGDASSIGNASSIRERRQRFSWQADEEIYKTINPSSVSAGSWATGAQ